MTLAIRSFSTAHRLPVLLAMAALLMMTGTAVQAHQDGMSLLSATGCAGCHGGQSNNTTVLLEGARTVRAGQPSNYTLTVAHPQHDYAGMNLSFKDQAGGNSGLLTPGPGSKPLNGELTHVEPRQMANHVAGFVFTWTAPAQHGIVNFNAAGNAVNHDGQASDIDDWNLSGAIQITVTGATITAPAAGASFCAGSPVTITWTQTGHTMFRIEASNNDFANVIGVNTNIAATAGTYTWTIPNGTASGTTYRIRLVDDATGAEITRSQNFTISGLPNILTQPENVMACEGRSFSVSVTAQGAGLIYRWRQNGVDVPGGTTATLTLASARAEHAGTYDCVITGCGTVTSNTATVTLTTRPTITTQPVGRSICEGDSAVFTVEAQGDGLQYQWLKNGEFINGATTKRLVIRGASLLDQADYTCQISGTCQPEAVTSVAKLIIMSPPKVTSVSPDQSLKAGDSLLLTVAVTGDSLRYQWAKNGTPVNGATSDRFRLATVARADSGLYTCTITNKCGTVMTRQVKVSVSAGTGPGVLAVSTNTIDLGTIALCGSVDTVLAGLLRNNGGSSLIVTDYTVEPQGAFTAGGASLPLTIAPSGTQDVNLRFVPEEIGTAQATITVHSNGGTATITVTATVVPAITFASDTLAFVAGKDEQAQKCNTIGALDCDSAVISAITISGADAGTYRIVSPAQLPMTIRRGETLDVCVSAIGGEGGMARVLLESTGGSDEFFVHRTVSSSVAEADAASSTLVVPNPVTDECRIMLPLDAPYGIRIVTPAGVIVRTLRGDAGTSPVRWDGRDGYGMPVASGTYVIGIEQGGRWFTQFVTVTR